jgi:hypothetical protein
MVEDLRRQGAQLKPQTREKMQERDDPWGNRDATSMFKEVGDSAETEYDNDITPSPQKGPKKHLPRGTKRCAQLKGN